MTTPVKPLTPDELADRLADVLGLSGLLYRRVLRAVERTAPAEGMPAGVRAVLDLLRRHGPMSVPQLSRGQALSRQFVQRMVNGAEAAHWVEPVPNPAHRRSPLIRLTAAGDAALTAVTRREREFLRGAGGELTGAEIAACAKVLGRMLELFDGAHDTAGPAVRADAPSPPEPDQGRGPGPGPGTVAG
ncbi:MarR family winged helix-turn-helix transcriptional regulator [Streptomyces sp. NPDC020875]|uniref:MarR family winged helix-turn-helix transcriptional regulator n=1 Tax=Streptomyces sp. NPDC020875 TaxID=3154898 RepID=UPI0033FB495C